jgi:hypothetical protein
VGCAAARKQVVGKTIGNLQDVPFSPAAAAAAEARRSWQGSRRPQQEPSVWQTAGRRRATPLLFSAACIVAGCVLFAGAVHVHQHLCVPSSYDPTPGTYVLTLHVKSFLVKQGIGPLTWCHLAELPLG